MSKGLSNKLFIGPETRTISALNCFVRYKIESYGEKKF